MASNATEHTYELAALIDRLKELHSLFTDERTKIFDGPAELCAEDKEIVSNRLDDALSVL